VLNDPAVAVTVTGSPGNTAGGAASADNVTGGAFLHPMGITAKLAVAKIRPTDFDIFEYIASPPSSG
jgi:hypothetical protein